MKNRIEKQKNGLIAIAILALVVGALLVASGSLLFVHGAGLGDGQIATKIVDIILGILQIVVGLGGIVYGFIFFVTGGALTATKKSYKEENLAKHVICPKCQEEVPNGASFCPYCGEKLEE